MDFITEDNRNAEQVRKAQRRKALAEALKNGKRVTINNGLGESIVIPRGPLASDDDARKRREEIRKKLLSGGVITVGTSGNVTGNSNGDSAIRIPVGKLALKQWYENNPELLEAEIAAMQRFFPQFELKKLNDGRLYWEGSVEPGIYESKFGVKKTYYLMAVYQQNHPHQQMGSSVYVYPVLPSVEEISRELYEKTGKNPSHLLKDSDGNLYLCTATTDSVKVGETVTTAASVMAWAIKWLTAFELVLTDDLEVEKFIEHGGI